MIKISFVTTTPGFIGDTKITQFCELRNFKTVGLQYDENNKFYFIELQFMHDVFDVVNFINQILVIKWLYIATEVI